MKTTLLGIASFAVTVFLAASLAFPQSVLAQTRKSVVISGVVTDAETGEPVIAAGVMVKASNTGAVTDVDGAFAFSVSNKDAVIVVKALGYVSQEIALEGQTSLEIALKPDVESLEDLVVIGYGAQKKATVTGALTVVNTDVVAKATTPSLANALGGVVPGLITRQSSGEPGYDGATLLIRGLGSWQNARPLVLVDGIERDINLINTDEIESFSILKDASATAVYGMRGANGVVLINTKKGAAGKAKVTFRSEMTQLHGLRFPEYVNAAEFATLMNEACEVSGIIQPWSDEDIEIFRDGSDPYSYPNVNWTDEVLKKNSFQTMNTLSVSGGNEIVRYYASAGYSSQSGLFKEDPSYDYRTNSLSDRYNLRSTVDVSVSKNISLTVSLAEIIENRTYPGTPSGDIFWSLKVVSPIAYPVRNPDGSFGSSNTSYEKVNPYVLATNSGFAKQFRSTTQGTFSAKWDLGDLVTPGLNIEANFAFDRWSGVEQVRHKVPALKNYLGVDPITGEDKYTLISEETAMGYGYNFNDSNRAYYYDFRANYNRGFNGHNISALMMVNRRDYQNLVTGNSIANLPYRYQGFAGRLAYNYKQRYLAEVNFGYNGSENFAKGHRYGFFPAVSAGWVISEEEWWKVRAIDHLKFRGSYGLVGNDAVGGNRFFYMSAVNKNAAGYGFGVSQNWYNGMAESQMGSDNATWEVSHKLDLGFDLEMLDRRLRLGADYFFEHRDHILLVRKSIPAYVGASGTAPMANIGVMDNVGFDANVEFSDRTRSGFFYTVRGNVTFAHNTIVDDDTPEQLYKYQNTRGHSANGYLGYTAIGLFQSQDEIDNSPVQQLGTYTVGDVKYKDTNNDGFINAYDRTWIGYAREPELMFGFGFTIGYKGFDLSANFTGAARTTILLDSAGMWPFLLDYPGYNIYTEYYNNRFIPGADNTNAKYPVVHNGSSVNNYQISTLYQHDASYLKLKTAELGYTLPKKALDKINVEKIRFFLNGNNLLCLDHLNKMIDPESNHLGASTYPTQRGLTLGVEVGF